MIGYTRQNTGICHQIEVGQTYDMKNNQFILYPGAYHMMNNKFIFYQYAADAIEIDDPDYRQYQRTGTIISSVDSNPNYFQIKADGEIIEYGEGWMTHKMTVIKKLNLAELLTHMPSYIERPNGTKKWWQNGLFHRPDGPAVEYFNGDKHWYQFGRLHRLDGPASEHADGDRMWCQNGRLHRLDGPAFEKSNGAKIWYQNGQRHRLDGPALEEANGTKKWFINGEPYEIMN